RSRTHRRERTHVPGRRRRGCDAHVGAGGRRRARAARPRRRRGRPARPRCRPGRATGRHRAPHRPDSGGRPDPPAGGARRVGRVRGAGGRRLAGDLVGQSRHRLRDQHRRAGACPRARRRFLAGPVRRGGRAHRPHLARGRPGRVRGGPARNRAAVITGRRRRDSTDESPARTATGHYSSPMTQAWVRALTAARLRTRKLGAARRDSGPADLGPAETGTSETGTSETGTESGTSETTVFFRHLPFAAVLLVIVLVVAAVDPARLGDPPFFSATVLGVAATVASMILPWERLPRWSPALVALADMAVVVLIEASGVRCSVLLVLPVLWLSTSFGPAGVVLSITAGTLAVWVPLFAGSMPTTLAERHTLVPLALAAAAIYVFLAERRSSARRALLSKQSALVEEALESA